VRAPVFALSNRAAEGIIEGNAADGFPVGLVHPPSMRGILESSQGHFRGVIQETLNTYHGDFVRLFKVQLIKLRALVDPFEVPNNVGFSYGVELSPVLRGTLGYGIVFPLGLAGFFLSLRAWRRHVLVALYGLTMVGGLMAVPILARYRLILVPVLLLYAAVLLVSLSDALRERNAHRVIGTLGLMLAASLVQHVIVPLDERTKDRVHALDYLGAARVYAEDDQFDRAANEMRRLLDKAQRSPRHIEGMALFETDYRVFLARSLIAQGAWEEAKGQIDLAIAAHARIREPVSYPYLNFGALYLKMGESAKAKTFLVRFLELEPEGPLAEKVRRVLARLEDPS
jgi:hypothetical protein